MALACLKLKRHGKPLAPHAWGWRLRNFGPVCAQGAPVAGMAGSPLPEGPGGEENETKREGKAP